jgi:hypothetical protein
MKMMDLKEKKTPLFDIWNSSQVFLGKAIAMATGDLYCLTKVLEKLKKAKN